MNRGCSIADSQDMARWQWAWLEVITQPTDIFGTVASELLDYWTLSYRAPGVGALPLGALGSGRLRSGSSKAREPEHRPCPHFGLGLWLQTPCAGRAFWAYNAEHLDFLRHYVEAAVRERTPNANATLASRLPKWVKSSKNRDTILRAIDKLERKLPPVP